MELFLLGLISAFSATFVTSSATALAKRLFGETQKPPPPNTKPNVTVVVVYVFIV